MPAFGRDMERKALLGHGCIISHGHANILGHGLEARNDRLNALLYNSQLMVRSNLERFQKL
jgi:hypothetical protein